MNVVYCVGSPSNMGTSGVGSVSAAVACLLLHGQCL